MPDESIRWFVNFTRAVMPWTSGAVRPSWTAAASGFGGGLGPSSPASAIALPPAATAQTLAQSAARRGVEMVRRKLTLIQGDRCPERGWDTCPVPYDAAPE